MKVLRPLSSVGRWRVLFILLACLVLADRAAAQGGFVSVHGVSDADYQTWVNKISKDGLRLVQVSGYTVGNATRFAAIAIDDGRQLPWVGRHHLSANQYQQEFNKWSGQGYQLVSVSGYPHNGVTNYAAVWAKIPNGPAWQTRSGLSTMDYQKAFDQLGKQGYRPIHVAGYPVGNTHQLAAIWVKDGFNNWVARHDLTADQYQQEVTLQSKNGLRPLSVSGYQNGKTTLFAAVFVGDTDPWVARHNLTADEYQKAFKKWVDQGYTLQVVNGYASEGQVRYAAIWTKGAGAALVQWPLPMTGQGVLELAAFDQAMQQFMRERNITGGTLAVTKNGRIVLARGYGYADPFKGKLLGPDTPFRVASVSKPITLALILKLIRDGKLTLDTKIVAFLGITPPPGQQMDPRWKNITVQHLIEHKGGWDRDTAFDPMFQTLKIANALGKPGPATAVVVIKYMAGQPLQFDPGSKSVYSNFGYCILGRVVEKVTGTSYTTALHKEILQPLGLKSIELGRTLPQYRNPLEPLYLAPGTARNVMLPKSTVQVPWPDGGFYLEAMDAHGGLIASAPDLVRFLNAYWMNGQLRKGGSQSWTFFGSLPGTWTMVRQRPDGVNIAVLFNQREDASKLSYDSIQQVMNEAADKIQVWPR